MRVSKGRPYAILTGDIVGSRKLEPAERRRLPRVLERLGTELAAWPQVPLALSRHRGDGWQVLVSAPDRALRAALFVRTTLRSRFPGRRVDTRIAVGVGTLDFLPGDRIADGDGAAYRLSGAALEERASSHLRFAAEKPRSEIGVVFELVDALARDWTPAQATALRGALLDWTQEKIAAKWPDGAISQQAVAQHLRRAGWDAVDAALTWYETQAKPEKL